MISELRRALLSGDSEKAQALVSENLNELSEVLDCAIVTCRAAHATGYRGLGVLRLRTAIARLEGHDFDEKSTGFS